MFNAKRRDNPSMDRYMDIKKAPFGGPNEKDDFDKSKRKSLQGYQRVIERDPNFEGGNFNHNYDTTWKAISRDRISRDAKKKPFDPMYAKTTVFTQEIEEGKVARFEEFTNENFEYEAKDPEINDVDDDTIEGDNIEGGYEVDQEQLDMLIEEFGKDLKKLIKKICDKMEIEQTESCDLICAAVEKTCSEPAEEDEIDSSEEDEAIAEMFAPKC